MMLISPRYSRLSWLALGVLLLLLAGGFACFVWDQWRSDLASSQEDAGKNMQLLSRLVQSDLQQGNYQSLEKVVSEWGTLNSDVVTVELNSRGVQLAYYARKEASKTLYRMDVPVLYSYSGQANLSMTVDLSGVVKRRNVLISQVSLVYVLLAGMLIALTRSLLLQHRRGLWLEEVNQGLQREIIQRQHADEALQHSKELLASAQDIAHLGSWEWDLQSGHLSCSDEQLRIIGWSSLPKGVDLGKLLSTVYPDDRAALRAQLEALAMGGAMNMQMSHRIVRPNGEVRSVRAAGRLFLDAAGKPKRIVGTLLDITDQVRVNEALQITQAAVESSINAVALIDLQGFISYVNSAFLNLFHLGSKAEVLGKPLDSLAIDTNDYQDHIFQHALHTGNWQGETRAKRLDGSMVELQLWVHLVCHEDGVPACLMLSCIDISERVAAERELRLFNEELEQRVQLRASEALLARDQAERASRAKSEFLSRMSHELRTPLNAILGFAQLLEASDLAADQRDGVKEIVQAGWHLLTLINEVLELSKIEAGATTVSLEVVSIEDVVTACLPMVSSQARMRGVHVVGLASDSHLCVRADRVRLKQVLINLLSNAIKYNRENGRVELACEQVEEGIRISVSDTGLGIAPERMPELFMPFCRLGAENTAVEGVGIGLALTRKLVELMGGQIGVESCPGEGCTFWILLPSALPLVVAPLVEEVAPQSAFRQGLRVLYIEDNPSNLRLVEHIFARWPEFELLLAKEPEEGLAVAAREQVDLVLLDINLPGMNGFDVLRRLRQLPSYRHLPIVAVSGNAMPYDIERARRSGFDDYLTKPIDISLLRQTLTKHLNGKIDAEG